MPRYLDNNMRRRAEAEQAKSLAAADLAQPQRTVADHPRTQQRRRLVIEKIFWEGVRERLIDDGEFGIAAIRLQTRKLGIIAEVLISVLAVLTLSAGIAQPRNADPISFPESSGLASARLYNPDDLVAGDYRQFRQWDVAFGRVQIGVTHAAGVNTDADFMLPRERYGDVG